MNCTGSCATINAVAINALHCTSRYNKYVTTAI